MTTLKPSLKYYNRFQPFISNPLWRLYIRWAYHTSLSDLGKLSHQSPFQTNKPSVLLCGVGSLVTAEEFIRFTLNQNSEAKIIIVDLRPQQIKQIKRLALQKFPKTNVKAQKLNALHLLKIIPLQSLDWIETDALFEFLSPSELKRLIHIWHQLLKPTGFATTRIIVSNPLTDWLLLKFATRWLHTNFYRHQTQSLENLFLQTGFFFVSDPTPIPYLKRYTLTPKP
ncbi:MAG: hypothetical protein HYS86_01545 [Candidatus Chisholmbacteria bacterium]|nr:hypothetical protein [Candidatus Chisholmbacteria bacterium]